MRKARYVPIADIPIEFFLACYTKTLAQLNGFTLVRVDSPRGYPVYYITRNNRYWLQT